MKSRVITAFQGDVVGSRQEGYREVNGDPDTFSVGFEMEAHHRKQLEDVAAKCKKVDIQYGVDYRSLTQPAQL